MSTLALVSLTALIVLAVLPWSLRRPARGRRSRRWRAGRSGSSQPRVDPAVALDILAAAISAGAAVPSALAALGTALPGAQGEVLRRVAAVLELGGDWEAAWAEAGTEFTPMARALRPAWVDGVAPEDLLSQAAASIRARRLDAAKDAAARLGVRLVLPMGVCLLPAFVLLGIVPVLLSAGGAFLP